MKPTTSYSYSHEQQPNPEQAAMLARAHTTASGARYLNEIAVHVDPGLWAQSGTATTETAGGTNLETQDYKRQVHTTVAETAASRQGLERQTTAATSAFAVEQTGRAQQLAEARRIAQQEAL